ncbi:MAG: hypothetical protein ACK5D9_10725 [Burkholderiales bacterium]|jgi:hypothetical protein
MSPPNPKKRRLLTMVVVIAVLVLAYAWYSARFPTWREEVRLSDGRVITIEQKRDHIEGRGTRRTWLTFSLPEMGGKQTWDQLLYPSIIDVAHGKVYVIGRPRGSLQFRFYGHPRYVYVAYEWRNGAFERIPFMSVPERLRQAENVYWCLPPTGAEWVDLAMKESQLCEVGDDNFPIKRIVDLETRIREADFWAGLGGNKPATE